MTPIQRPSSPGRPATCTFATALGRVRLAWTAAGICQLRFTHTRDQEEALEAPGHAMEAMRQLMAHLAGQPQDLGGIPLDLSELTPFQRQVAEVLRGTRPGRTISYGEVALLCGRPGTARAVGQAVKANPILILVPCHRVVAARGPGGWSAFGTPERKARLLDLEQPHTGLDDAPPA
ncbi:MAG: MGMT family protein [Holophagaceae bacterium]|nr:MGMT family protein [Holophagaceae bacterium]